MPDSSLTWPSPPKVEQLTENYTDERLQQGLLFAETILARRDITPRSVHFMTAFKDEVIDALEALTDDERKYRVGGVRLLERVLEKHDFLHVEQPDEVKKLQADLLSLRKTQYYARYGEYLNEIPNQVRSYVTGSDIPNNSLLSSRQQWTEIAEEIAMENDEYNKLGPSNASKVKYDLHRVLKAACTSLGIDHRHAEWSIIEYGDRNKEVHRDMDALKAAGDYVRLAEMMHHDYKDVDFIFSDIDKDEVDKEHLRSVVLEQINRWFVVPEDISQVEAWRVSKELFDFTNNAKDAKFGKLSRAEKKAANKPKTWGDKRRTKGNSRFEFPRRRTRSE